MALIGKVFAERKAVSNGRQDASADLVGSCTEFGTLLRETIMRLGLRHVYTMPVVLNDQSVKQVFVYQAEVLWRKQWRTVYVREDEAQ